uniref:Uncharacterized protein n=1 Tax=Electrophorus electricus TaxID=8005 RepID=A0A4W4HJZ2_ELEEL
VYLEVQRRPAWISMHGRATSFYILHCFTSFYIKCVIVTLPISVVLLLFCARFLLQMKRSRPVTFTAETRAQCFQARPKTKKVYWMNMCEKVEHKALPSRVPRPAARS